MTLFIAHLASGIATAIAVWILCQLGPIHRRPALCHALWGLLLIRLVTPPLAQIPVSGATAKPAAVVYEAAVKTPAARDKTPTADGEPTDSAVGAEERKPSTVTVRAATRAVDQEPNTRMVPARSASQSASINAPALLMAGSLAVTVLIGISVLRQYFKIRRWLRRLSPSTDRAIQAMRRTAARFQLRRAPRLLMVDAAVTPMLWVGGPQGAAILLPRQLVDSLQDEELEAVLAHELAHWIRRDHWTSLLALMIVSVVWWNPLAWIARRQMLAAAEASCDALAIERLEHGRKAYAKTLLHVMDLIEPLNATSPALGVTFGGSQPIVKRFQSLCDERVKSQISVMGQALLVLTVASLVVLPVMSEESTSPPVIVGMDPEIAGDLIAVLGDDAGRVSGFPRSLAVDPSGKRVYLPETNGMVSVYDTDSLRCVQKLRLHSLRCLDLALFDEGQKLVSISTDGSARLWDISGEAAIRLDEFPIVDKPAWVKMSASRKGELFVFRSERVLCFESIHDGKFVERSRLTTGVFGKFGIPHDFAISPDGLWLATCDRHESWTPVAMTGTRDNVEYSYHDATLALWKLMDGKPQPSFTVDRKVVNNLGFSADSKHLLGDDPYFLPERVSYDWRIENGKLNSEPVTSPCGGYPFGNHLTTRQDGRLSARVAGQEVTILVNEKKGPVSRAVIATHQRIFSVAFLGDDVLLVAENLLQRWDWRDGQYRQRRLPVGHHGSVAGLHFDPEGNSLISVSADSALEWNLKKLKPGVSVPAETLALGPAIRLRDGTDRKEFLVLQRQEEMELLKGFGPDRDGKLIEQFSIEMEKGSDFEQCWCIAMHPTKRIVATGHHNNKICLWSVEEGEPGLITSWKGHEGHVCDLAFSPDGKLLASVGWDHRMIVWNIAGHSNLTVAPRSVLAGTDEDIIRTVAWSKDGKLVAAGGEFGHILLWQIDKGHPQEPQRFVDPQDDQKISIHHDSRTISRLEFSASGKNLLCSDGKGRVSIWSVDSARQLKKWTTSGWIREARYSPDESMIAIANSDGSVYLVRAPKFDVD